MFPEGVELSLQGWQGSLGREIVSEGWLHFQTSQEQLGMGKLGHFIKLSLSISGKKKKKEKRKKRPFPAGRVLNVSFI